MITSELEMNNEQYCNFMAIDLLEKLGHGFPTQQQIDFVENQLSDLLQSIVKS